MRVTVDRSICDEHGLCAMAAPSVFEINDDGELVYDQNPDDSERDQTEEAMGSCPVQAISIAD
ncbi:ferredoxin [Mycolicibacterium confluentis]|nr:ferredoxin [Mycolicibacterium confluentis]MCV7320600.1 ferredoxin [Mycolicibacterium confluentis]ORV30417.1 ferredoxin [Mycolicibacterium confluentis]